MPPSEAMSFAILWSFAPCRCIAANPCTLACRAHGKACTKLTSNLFLPTHSTLAMCS